MATIDDKVVAMSFESGKFESGVSKTISALDKLKAALHFPDAGKGLDNINASAKRVDLSHISKGVEDIRAKLGYLSVAALAVFAQIAQRAVAAGASLVKAFTLDPLIAGFKEYATNLNAIQTILANTEASGATLKDVNAALNELNRYSDKTIYNFAQMARNIGTFTAAGVDLDTATNAIKGIANLAALSGSNADQASTAMYQLSQAISSGAVKLMDWNSVVNAGMGGTVFQRALAQTAEAMGTLKQGSVDLIGPMKNVSIAGQSFRQSLSTPGKDSWLTSKVLTTTLQQFTGDLTDAQLAAEGFNAEQIKAIQQTAKTAMHAATEVKTLSQVLDVAKETAGSGWAQTWQIIFGNFTEAKTTFTNLSNAINGIINSSANARNKVLSDWKALGGRTVLITAISTAFHNLGLVLKPIKEAFREIFPAKTGQDLYNLTLRFKAFADALKPGQETMANLKRTFAGLFAVLDIGKMIIGGIFTMFGELLGVMHEGSGGVLNFTGSIGDFLVSVDKALKKGDRLHNFFATLGKILSAPTQLIAAIGHALSTMFSGFSPGGFFQQMGGLTGAMTPFQKVMEVVSALWDGFLNSIRNSGDFLRPVIQAFAQGLAGIGVAIGNAASTMNFEAILAAIRTGLFAGLVLMFKQFLGKGSFLNQISKGFGGGIIKNISGTFGALQGSMVAMQNNIRAKTLKEIAIAIALLAASVVALSFVDPKKLNASLGAMTIAFGELLGAMALLTSITKTAGFIKLPVMAASLILLAGAIDLLSVAVVTLSLLSWDKLLKGLTGVGALLGIISAAAIPLSASSAGLTRAGVGITAIAIGLNILALAVAQFGNMGWTEMGKGMVGVAAGLSLMAVAMRAMPPGMVVIGAGLVVVATGLKILAGAVIKFGSMDWNTLGKGLAGVAGSLIIIAGAMHLMPMNTAVTAAGLLLVALALGKIADAIITMGGMSIREIAKGLSTLAGSLVILAAALYLMSGSLAGAAALTVAAAGLALLAPALTALGKQSWKEILKSMVTLAAALTVLGVAGLVMAPVVPVLLGLGLALVLIGGGLALAGAGVFLISAGLSALAIAGPTAVGILIAAILEFEKALPEMLKNLVLGLLEMVNMLAEVAPKFVDAMVKIITQLLNVIIKSAPKMAEAFTAILRAALTVLHDNQAKIIQAGFELIIALLQGIKNNINKVVTMGADIIVKFLKGVASQAERVVLAAGEMIGRFILAMAKAAVKLADTGAQAIINFLNGVADVIKQREPEMMAAGVRIGVAIVEGMLIGLGQLAQRLYNKATEIMGKVIGILKKIPFINSPSKVTTEIGASLVEGLVKGLDTSAVQAYSSAIALSNGVIDSFNDTFQTASPSKVMMEIGKYVGQGFAQGLRGSGDDVKSAFDELNQKLTDAMTTARETIASEQDKLDKLRAAKTPDAAAIKAAQAVIDENEAILARSTAGHKALVVTLKSEKIELIGLTKEYQAIGEKLQNAKDALAAATQTRNDAIKGFSDQYSTLPDVVTTDAEGNSIDQLAKYEESLKHQADAVAAYQSTLQQLRKLGLDDATYQKLLQEGTADQAFASQLLAGGKTAVQGLNKLDAQLAKVSKTLATQAAKNLYQAGVDAATGLVKGLQAKESAIHNAIVAIANDMIETLRRKLGIKSPSQEFADIGRYSMEGMAQGFSDSSKLVTDAIDQAAKDALSAMKQSMRDISSSVTDELNPNPVITPILDLTQIRNQAEELAAMTKVTPITAAASYGQASMISTQQNTTAEEQAILAAGASVKFEQNNYSPEALSEIEIYRQTKNQLSQLKSVLAIT